MNSLKLNLFDTAIFTPTPSVADAFPDGMVRRTRPQAQPAPLWRQSLAAMDNAATGRAHRAAQTCFVILGTLSAGSVVIAAVSLVHGLGAHQGLHSAVQTLMTR